MDATEAKVTLAVDVMGSDRGPQEILAGISQSLENSPRGTRFLLYGREDIIDKHIQAFDNFNSGQVEIRHAPKSWKWMKNLSRASRVRKIPPWLWRCKV